MNRFMPQGKRIKELKTLELIGLEPTNFFSIASLLDFWCAFFSSVQLTSIFKAPAISVAVIASGRKMKSGITAMLMTRGAMKGMVKVSMSFISFWLLLSENVLIWLHIPYLWLQKYRIENYHICRFKKKVLYLVKIQRWFIKKDSRRHGQPSFCWCNSVHHRHCLKA